VLGPLKSAIGHGRQKEADVSGGGKMLGAGLRT
jgi:hypothetical protein